MAETLLKNLSKDGYIRASYMQLGADTGRMSCMSPNLQQIPRDQRFRACVQAPAGWKFVVADYGQMELRLAAAEAKDSLMTQVFQQGKDLHTITATQIYGVGEDEVTKEQRQVSKSANFGLLYGSGAKGLRNYAAAMGIQMDLDEAAEVREKFHAAYKGISQWQQQNARAADAAKDNPSIRIRISGLRRFLPGEHNKLTTRCNTPIQGAGAAVLKLTLGKLWPLLHADGEDVVRLAGVVHDEIILLVKEEHADTWALQLQTVMEEAEARWLGEIPPLAEAKVGDSWQEAK
jgi:DNA polymerase I-like protein with 3'-5' exonuclease and polymerase domains